MATDNGTSIKFAGGQAADFDKTAWGIDANQAGFSATQSVSITQSMSTVEAKNNQGEVVGVLVYDKRAEITIEGIANELADLEVDTLGESMEALKGTDGSGLDGDLQSSTIMITEIGVELSNEDWKRFSLKGNVYELVTEEAT